MTNESIIREFIQKVWNEKDLYSVERYVHPVYTIQIDTGDPWEGKRWVWMNLKYGFIIHLIRFRILTLIYNQPLLMENMLPSPGL